MYWEALLYCSESMSILLSKGVDVTARDTEGKSALHYAAQAGYADSVALLLDSGAEIDGRDQRGMTPLMCAAATNIDASVVDLLLARGADPVLKDKAGWNALRYYVRDNADGGKEIAKSLQKAMKKARASLF